MLPTFSKKLGKNLGKTDLSGISNIGGGNSNKEDKTPSTKERDVRFIIAVVVAVISVLSTIGLFGAKEYIKRTITALETSIVTQEEALQINVIRQLVLLDTQIRKTKSLNDSRLGHKIILDEIAKIVVPNVKYNSAEIKLVDDRYEVEIQAVSKNLLSYLEQIEVINASKGISEKIDLKSYSIDRDDAGNDEVSFKFELNISVDEVVNQNNN